MPIEDLEKLAPPAEGKAWELSAAKPIRVGYANSLYSDDVLTSPILPGFEAPVAALFP